MRPVICIFLSVLAALSFGSEGDFSQWRGPARDGIYPDKGLLKVWPEGGPRMIWSYEGLGAGHGSVAISRDRVFVLGMPDTIGVLYAFDHSGKLLWKRAYGEEWHVNYTGPRSTPTIVNDRMYFESGMGVLYCYDPATGNKIWSVDLLKKFNAKNITWGMAESILIDGDRLFCTPGGEKNNVVALNRFTGETIWTSPGNGQPAAYCSPLLFKHNNSSLIVTMTAASIICVDANTGRFNWQFPQFQSNKIHANTPLYHNGRVYCSSQSGRQNSGLVAIDLSGDGTSASIAWRNEKFGNLMAGIILREGYIYGSMYQKNTWSCINTRDGQILYSFTGLGDGVVIWADGLFYCYTEDGDMALASADPGSFKVISRFRITMGTSEHWSHPVIRDGRLYVRHGNALMVYDIKAR